MLDSLKTFFDRFKSAPSNPTKDLTMRQVFSVLNSRRFPSWKQWKRLPSVLSSFERRVFQTAVLLFILSLGTSFGVTLFGHRIEIPANGGEYTEALVGDPQLINPLYAVSSDTDQDLVSLIYSGLLKWNPENGLVPDLAESFEVNEEKTVYTFILAENAKFQNNDPVLARDVLFTISAIQNPAYRSPLAPKFHGVSLVQEDDRKISFILEKSDPLFLNNLTIGILPSSAWADILPQNAPLAALNLQPIGSGPFQFVEFTKDKKGAIRSFTLKSFDQYLHGRPHIDRLTFKFYPDTQSALDALANKFVEGISVVPFSARKETGQNRAIMLYSPLLSREVVLYFNQKTNDQLKKLPVREAIAQSINKHTIVDETLLGSGQVIIGPILPGSIGYSTSLVSPEQDLEKAKTSLTTAGVITKPVEAPAPKEGSDETEVVAEIKQPNHFTLTTIDTEEFVGVAQTIKTQLEQIGLDIEIIPVPAEILFDEVIKPRNFELLLTTLMFSTETDPYLFWHSSQKDGVGLNIVDYQNTEVDKLLETARTSKNPEEQQSTYQSFQEKLLAEVPAVFLYQSAYGYAITKKVHVDPVDYIRIPSDRFATIQTWYIKTKKAFQ